MTVPALTTTNPHYDSSQNTFLSWIRQPLKTVKKGFFACGVGLGINQIAANTIKSAISWDSCPRLPEFIYTHARCTCLIREFFPIFESNISLMTIKVPIIEELIFRFGLQEILLKKVPKSLLNRVAPSYARLVHSKIAQIARIGLSALAFSLGHAVPAESGWPSCSTLRLVNTFAIGLLLGMMQEVSESPILPMLFHAGFNLPNALIIEKFGIRVGCNF